MRVTPSVGEIGGTRESAGKDAANERGEAGLSLVRL